MKRLIVLIIIVVIFFIGYLSSYTVTQGEWAVVTQFGKPVRTLVDPGFYFKMPDPIQRVNRFDKRIELFESEPIQYMLADQNPLIITTFLIWKISDPLRYFQAIGMRLRAQQQIEGIVTAQMGDLLGHYQINQIINTDHKKIRLKELEDQTRKICNDKTLKKYGVELVKIGVQRITYPKVVNSAVYKRMKAEREKEAAKIRNSTMERVNKIKTEADQEAKLALLRAEKAAALDRALGDQAAMKLYGETYQKNLDFFTFLKSLELYEKSIGEQSVLILSTKNPIFKNLFPLDSKRLNDSVKK